MQGDWGTLNAGRQTTVLADVVGTVDPLGVRYSGYNRNVSIAALSAHRLGLEYGAAGATTGSFRLDNSLKYVARFGDFSVRAMHAFGERAVNSSNLSSTGLSVSRVMAFAEYKLLKRTRAYLELDTTRWKDGYPVVGTKSTANGVSLGVVHSF